MKFLLRILFILGILITQFLSLPSASQNGATEEQVAPRFPWGDAKIQVAQCLSAKRGMVMLYLKFDRPLQPEEFNSRNYALVKWIEENNREVEFNEHLRGTQGILPGFGFIVKDFTLGKLLPWPQQECEALVRSINRMAGCKSVDIHTFTLCGTRGANTTLIVMPFMTLMTLKDFVEDFNATTGLVELVEEYLSPTFDHMMQQGIVHGDLALRNVGVTFKECGPFANYKSAFAAIDNVVLYDFGGKKTRFLGEKESFPENENLDYILNKVKSKIGIKLPRSSTRREKLTTPQQNLSGCPSPIKLLRNQERIIGTEHAFYGDPNERSRKKKRTLINHNL